MVPPSYLAVGRVVSSGAFMVEILPTPVMLPGDDGRRRLDPPGLWLACPWR
jgi:hypothetical protein